MSSLFVRLAMVAVSKFDVNVSQTHLDSSSFSVHGQYLSDERDSDSPIPAPCHEVVPSSIEASKTTDEQPVSINESHPVTIEVRRGYSRDHRPDLMQFVSNLCCSRDGGVPLFLEVASGNQSDRQEFGRLMQDFHADWDVETLFVVDSAFYSKPNLSRVKSLLWISRVPLTIREAQGLIHQDTTQL